MSNCPNFRYRSGRPAVRVETQDERPVFVVPAPPRPRRIIRSAGVVGLSTVLTGVALYAEADAERADAASMVMVPGNADPPLNATFAPAVLGVAASGTASWDNGGDGVMVTLAYPTHLG